MNFLDIASQIYDDIRLLTSESPNPDRYTSFYLTDRHLNVIQRKTITPIYDNTQHDEFSKADNRLNFVISKCLSHAKAFLYSEEENYTYSENRILADSDYMKTIEELAFYVFSMACVEQKSFNLYGSEKNLLDKPFFQIKENDSAQHPLMQLCLESYFSKPFVSFLFDFYEQWPKEWQQHYDKLVSYSLKQVHISAEDYEVFLSAPHEQRITIAPLVLSLSYEMKGSVDEFLLNQKINTQISDFHLLQKMMLLSSGSESIINRQKLIKSANITLLDSQKTKNTNTL